MILRRLFELSLLFSFASTCLLGADRPNILWLTCEDIGPHLGCYGDKYADTPNLDRLAERGMRYLYAWSNAPVCAPARTAIISGMYSTSLGAQHMRSLTRLPEGMLMYPQYLRRAGYWCTNNAKEDYNLVKPGKVWDESSRRAHWKNRPAGKPFFAVFNIGVTHESRIRKRPHRFVHDPAQAPVPRYHPDTPEVRKDWAQYYDNITVMDQMVGERLRELRQAGLAEDTIVFFYGDHGSGMPRSKRCAYDSGLRVPLIVYIPEKYRHLAGPEWRAGGASEHLVSFVDLAPTILSLAGIKPPEHMQGHAFLGKYRKPSPRYLFGFRGRMDERYDMVRSVRDRRFIYVRNYMPFFPAGQHVWYMFITRTTRVWKELFDQGKLTSEQAAFWKPRPPEELYDLKNDPDEVRNLASLPQYRSVLERMREAHRRHVLAIRDLGFLPEQEIHDRAGGGAPYTMGHDPERYPLERIMAIADLASRPGAGGLERLKAAMLREPDCAARYWACLGVLARGKDAAVSCRKELRSALNDSAPAVRIAAAWVLGKFGSKADVSESLRVLRETSSLKKQGYYTVLLALTAIDDLDESASALLPYLKELYKNNVEPRGRGRGYVKRILEKIIADLEK